MENYKNLKYYERHKIVKIYKNFKQPSCKNFIILINRQGIQKYAKTFKCPKLENCQNAYLSQISKSRTHNFL